MKNTPPPPPLQKNNGPLLSMQEFLYNFCTNKFANKIALSVSFFVIENLETFGTTTGANGKPFLQSALSRWICEKKQLILLRKSTVCVVSNILSQRAFYYIIINLACRPFMLYLKEQ